MSEKDLHTADRLPKREVNQAYPGNESEVCTDTHPDLEKKLKQVNEHIAELHLAVRTAVADAANARLRAQAHLARANKFAIEDFGKALLPFKDALETALSVETRDVIALKAGLELCLKQLQAAFEKQGLREIRPEPGDPFDERRHRPLVKLGADDRGRVVAGTEQKGYEIGGRVIRPALVLLRSHQAARSIPPHI